ncbi:uncharacterized protein LOC8288719 isoform X2 [Ricinus communis]|uniref:DUF7795 domain-containing protein n=1 Tax=Ricinus communis TaxID=3988 RepID=B9SSD4_RICCO|nr:uncharacterized protein LOC8288719 isoform X2 [Ricinus communis]EEF33482.1 hypothetical protein RCOM_0188110 [Ricinus communis]|eukprot:XP_002528902.1 uncharacterized protein LOC8288719 isoform X2 [Ricinus communis]
MGTKGETKLKTELQEMVLQTFTQFSTRVAKIEELGAVGSRLLSGFQQGLELLRRSPLNSKSELIQSIIKANETERVKTYMAAGCIKNYDSIQNMSNLNACLLGLQDHLTKAKSILNELENLLEDLASAINSSKESFSPLKDEDLCEEFDQRAIIDQEEMWPSALQESEVTDYAALMGIIYNMVKQDYVMQERIVTSLNLKSLPGELESYCLMWSLRPFINDEIMHQAWRLVD